MLGLRRKPTPLRIRKLADRTDGQRVARFHPETGERMLVRPETIDADGFDYTRMRPEPWPLRGVQVEGDLPKRCVVSTAFVTRAALEGWATVEGKRAVHRPGGPPEEPWRLTHTFIHADAVVLHLTTGDVRYRVARNPDKWPKQKQGDVGFGGEVHWTYLLERED